MAMTVKKVLYRFWGSRTRIAHRETMGNASVIRALTIQKTISSKNKPRCPRIYAANTLNFEAL